MTKREKNVVIKELTVKKERRFRIGISLKTVFYILVAIFIFIIIYIIVDGEHLIIYIVRDENIYEIYLFSTIVPLMLLMYLLSCGFTLRITKRRWIKYVFFGIIVYLIYLGYTLIGIGIQFNTNFDLLNYEFYESNSYRGVKFFAFNYYPFFFFVYIISLIFDVGDE